MISLDETSSATSNNHARVKQGKFQGSGRGCRKFSKGQRRCFMCGSLNHFIAECQENEESDHAVGCALGHLNSSPNFLDKRNRLVGRANESTCFVEGVMCQTLAQW